MYISSREKMIIEILLSENQKIRVNDLAKEIAVSTRTIHRDLNGIEEFLKEYDLALTRKTGVGIQITGSIESKESLKRKLMTFTLEGYMAEERQTLLLSMLYEADEPVKLFTLANELKVTVATISNDLLKLEEELAHFQLSITRRRGYGIELSGSEEAKRRAISYTISKSLNEDEFLSLIRRNREKKQMIHANAISDRLLHLIDREKVLAIEETVRHFNSDFISSMTESAYVGLIVHLSLAIERIQRGEKIEMASNFLAQLKDKVEYQTAKKMINQLKKQFGIDIPEAEIGYITMHLQGAKLRERESVSLEDAHLKTLFKARQLVQEVEMLTNCQLTNHAPLLEGLVTHLKPALYRIKQGMGIRNPLLPSIQKDYEELFELVKRASETVFPELVIPNEEIGFLVLHFGAAILGFEKDSNLTAYVVCSSGIGTSKMLATQLRREIPEIKEVRNVSAFDLEEITVKDKDLVITTIQLTDVSFEYLVVSPFLTDEEIQQIQMFAKKKLLIQTETIKSERVDLSDEEDVVNRIQRIHDYSGTMSIVLENFVVQDVEVDQSFQQSIYNVCQALAQKQVIRDADEITQALFEREALGSLGIPDTKMALFHTRHKGILKPSFTIYRIREPLHMSAMDGTKIDVTTILLLLAPNPYPTYGMEVLSYISSMIIESEKSIKLFQSGDERRIHTHIGRKLEEFLQGKIK